jgi:Methyltransferase domain
MRYDLSHLVQDPSQAVLGPIQDDEALLLYAICRVTCAHRIAEFGGESGYSAQNFLAAIGEHAGNIVYTVDSNPVTVRSPHHRFIHKLAQDVVPGDFDDQKLDLVFFDCHDFGQQLQAFHTLSRAGVVAHDTFLALHDTGTHPEKLVAWAFRGFDGFIHQTAERRLVSHFQELGYECISFHASNPTAPLRFRHGLTICHARQSLANFDLDSRTGHSPD